MKLDLYIEKLKELLDEHGNLDVVYASDDEGNAYHQVHNEPCVFYFYSSEDYYLDRVHIESCDDSEIKGLYKVIVVN